jgi:Fe2+ transport system protein FeoA
MDMRYEGVLSLDMLRPGEWGDIADIAGEPSWVCRMAELGLREGCRVQLLQGGTPCLLRVADCKLCLRQADSTQIFVRPVPAPVG